MPEQPQLHPDHCDHPDDYVRQVRDDGARLKEPVGVTVCDLCGDVLWVDV